MATLADTIRALDLPATINHLDDLADEVCGGREVVGTTLRATSLILQRPDPKRERKRDAFLDGLGVEVARRFGSSFGHEFEEVRHQLRIAEGGYLHYDPAVVKYLDRRKPLPRQRMDFLLLLPGRQRIVIEVDGKHHFAEGEQASLKVYSQMVAADRDLRLAGYEIYRFGANELVGPKAEALIVDFLDRLFSLHRVAPAA